MQSEEYCAYLNLLLPTDPVILYDSILLTSFINSIQLLISVYTLLLIIWVFIFHCTILTSELDPVEEEAYCKHIIQYRKVKYFHCTYCLRCGRKIPTESQ